MKTAGIAAGWPDPRARPRPRSALPRRARRAAGAASPPECRSRLAPAPRAACRLPSTVRRARPAGDRRASTADECSASRSIRVWESARASAPGSRAPARRRRSRPGRPATGTVSTRGSLPARLRCVARLPAASGTCAARCSSVATSAASDTRVAFKSAALARTSAVAASTPLRMPPKMSGSQLASKVAENPAGELFRSEPPADAVTVGVRSAAVMLRCARACRRRACAVRRSGTARDRALDQRRERRVAQLLPPARQVLRAGDRTLCLIAPAARRRHAHGWRRDLAGRRACGRNQRGEGEQQMRCARSHHRVLFHWTTMAGPGTVNAGRTGVKNCQSAGEW